MFLINLEKFLDAGGSGRAHEEQTTAYFAAHSAVERSAVVLQRHPAEQRSVDLA